MSDTPYGDLGGGMISPDPANPDEHPPGDPCADESCDKPSTFGRFCAQHYCMSFTVGRAVS